MSTFLRPAFEAILKTLTLNPLTYSYVCHLNENSPQGTALLFSDAYSTQVHDDDMVRIRCSSITRSIRGSPFNTGILVRSQGKHGVFSLTLEKNNGTFEITPNVVERRAYFTIRVRNNVLLDYESRKSVEFVVRSEGVPRGASVLILN